MAIYNLQALFHRKNASGITNGKAVVLPVIYQWKSAVKFGGMTTGKTVD